MDIEILLFLQNIRNSLGGILNEFFSFITNVSVDYYIILIPLIIYWTSDKKKGLFIYLCHGLSCILNAVLKSAFCVYRPWIRDSRVKPLDTVIAGASGFSFPSGHTTSSSSVYLPIIKLYKKRKLTIFCIIMITLTMFSRMFVGVHTPQDVIVGLLIGLVSTYIVSIVSDYIDKNPDKDTLVLIIATIFTVLVLLYVGLKSYPIDYVDGKILVDPDSMKINSFKDPGTFFGVVVAWYLERRYFNFDISGSTENKVIRAIIGALLVVAYYSIVVNAVGKLININIVYFLLRASIPIVFIVLYPLTWTRRNKKAK